MFDWDDANIGHIATHGVLPTEAEEVVANNPLELEYQSVKGEFRTRQVGETSAGRILTVVTTLRNQLLRVVTAFPANRRQRAEFLAQKGRLSDGER